MQRARALESPFRKPMGPTSRPREEVPDPVAKKRSRRNEAEKQRNAKMDFTIRQIKTELEVGETTTKSDTLSLALESLRKLKEQNVKLHQQLYGGRVAVPSPTTGIDADAALLFCLAQNAGQQIPSVPMGDQASHTIGQVDSEVALSRLDETAFKRCNPQTDQ